MIEFNTYTFENQYFMTYIYYGSAISALEFQVAA